MRTHEARRRIRWSGEHFIELVNAAVEERQRHAAGIIGSFVKG